MLEKTLDVKLKRILADRSNSDFILADAKDADMAFGLAAPGLSPEHHSGEAKFKSLDEYRRQIREIIAQGLVDIVLMSAGTNDILTLRERLFDNSPITPAIRANDATDIWLAGAGGVYSSEPSRPFRTASLDYAMCGKAECSPAERKRGADLGLYSITFNNNLERDYESLIAYKEFRREADSKGFRHFLEVFSPNAPGAPIADVSKFVNDHIVRALAGVAGGERPVFLKIPYFGPSAMESLVSYDSSLVVGILGGSAGTAFDAFFQLWEAKKYGARVALYGRKINAAEHQLSFVKILRSVADGHLAPEEAVRAYHGELQKLRITPKRSLKEDLERTSQTDHYAGGGGAKINSASNKTQNNDENPALRENVRRNLERLDRIFG
ncbi:MAG: hypothetical protein Q4D38_09610 [Planctomycetia bacterium]|nr:hypothetical protein [Planctomycetia bacterium]